MKNKNIKILITLVIAIIAVIGYIIYLALNISNEYDEARLYVVICIMVVSFMLYVAFLYNKKRSEVDSILILDNNPDEFISQCQNKINSKNTDNVNTWYIYMSAGYKQKNDLKRMVDTLSKVDENQAGSLKLIYFNNLAYAYLMTDRDEEAFEIIETYKKRMHNAVRRKQDANEFLITLALYSLKKKEYNNCLEYINLSSRYKGLPFTNECFKVVNAWCMAESNNRQEAESTLFKIINESEYKGARAFAQNVFDRVIT